MMKRGSKYNLYSHGYYVKSTLITLVRPWSLLDNIFSIDVRIMCFIYAKSCKRLKSQYPKSYTCQWS